MPDERLYIADVQMSAQVKRRHIVRYLYALRMADDRALGTVLDAACGTGYGSALIKMHGARYVWGVDIDAPAIEHARRNWPIVDLFTRCDILQLALTSPTTVDAIFSIETIEHLDRDDQLTWLDIAYDLLKPGGSLVLTCPITNYPSPGPQPHGGPNALNPFHRYEPTLDELEQMLGPPWKQPEFEFMTATLTTGEEQLIAWAHVRKLETNA